MPGVSQRFVWQKQLSTAGTGKPISTQTICDYFGYSKRDASEALNILKAEDILSMAEELGYQPDTLTKLRKELKLTATKPEKPPAKRGGFAF
jgi:hypothetical protein